MTEIIGEKKIPLENVTMTDGFFSLKRKNHPAIKNRNKIY